MLESRRGASLALESLDHPRSPGDIGAAHLPREPALQGLNPTPGGPRETPRTHEAGGLRLGAEGARQTGEGGGLGHLRYYSNWRLDPRLTSAALPQRGPTRGKGGRTPGSVSCRFLLRRCARCCWGASAAAEQKGTPMTVNKDFKRLVRARMLKTGEAYTTARRRILETKTQPVKIDYATLAGMSDATIKARTGCTWKRWVGALDYVGADTW